MEHMKTRYEVGQIFKISRVHGTGEYLVMLVTVENDITFISLESGNYWAKKINIERFKELNEGYPYCDKLISELAGRDNVASLVYQNVKDMIADKKVSDKRFTFTYQQESEKSYDSIGDFLKEYPKAKVISYTTKD